MKIRTDFVTNSSSSSFIIDKKDVSFGKLIKLLLDMANEEYEYYWNDEIEETDIKKKKKKKEYKVKDIDTTTEYGHEWIHVASNFYLRSCTPDDPYEYRDLPDILGLQDGKTKKFDHHYLVDNLGTSRLDMDLVCRVLDENGIPFEYGYCD